jgi:hypothetical protein
MDACDAWVASILLVMRMYVAHVMILIQGVLVARKMKDALSVRTLCLHQSVDLDTEKPIPAFHWKKILENCQFHCLLEQKVSSRLLRLSII